MLIFEHIEIPNFHLREFLFFVRIIKTLGCTFQSMKFDKLIKSKNVLHFNIKKKWLIE